VAVRLTRASDQDYTRAGFFSAATNSFSVSMWLYPTSLPTAGLYHNIGGMDGSICPSIFHTGGQPVWTIGTSSNDFPSAVVAVVNTWVHCYFSRNGATKTLWINGVQVVTGSDAAGGSTQLNIGAWNVAAIDNWDGRMAAVKVWDGYAGDIDDAKQEMLQAAPVRLANLRAFYPFDVASTADSYTAAQTLTATGTPTSELGPGLPWQLFQTDDDVLSEALAEEADAITAFQTDAFQIGVFAPPPNSLELIDDVYYLRTTDVPARTAYTVCGWIKPDSIEGAFYPWMSLEVAGGGGALSSVGVYVGLQLAVVGDTDVTVRTIALDQWLFFAMTGSGTTLTGYTRYEGEGSLTSGAATQAAFTSGQLRINRDSSSQSGTARYSYVRVWDAVLSSSELLAESGSATPVRTSDLNGDYPFTSLATDDEDQSGLDNDWTILLGSPTLVADWPIIALAGYADLVGDAGVYTITGIAAILRAHRELVASGGSYAIGGTAAVPRARRELAANSGSYALTGPTASTQQYGRTSIGAATRPIQNLVKGISATIGADLAAGTCSIFAHFVGTGTAGGEFRAFVLTGTDFDTVVVQSDMRNDLSADGWYEFTGGTLASYAPTAGTAVVLAIGSTASGAPAISQDNAGLEGWSSQANITDVTPLTWGVPDGLIADVNRDYSIYLEGATTETVLRAHRELAASAGAYVITGTDATLSRPGREILADVGAYAITGTAAVLRAHRELLASAGSYGVTGTAATLRAHRELLASAGSYAVTGTSAALRARRELLALAGSYLITGTAATLQGARELLAAAGSIVITGTDATLTKNSIALTLDAQSGAFAITGTPAVLRAGRALMSDSGAWSISGVDAVLRGNRTLTASGGSVTVTGTAASLRRGLSLLGDSGIYTIAGTDAAFLLARVLLAEAGSVTIVGTDAILSAGVPVGPAPDVRRLDASAIDRMLLAIALDRQATPSAIERRQETSLP